MIDLTLKNNIQDMVTTYNDLLTLFDNLEDTEASLELSGALSEDGTSIRFLGDKIRSTVFADSSTASGKY